jgi:hypothetical protein
MKSRYSTERIASILQQKKDGTPVIRLCCEHDISVATFYTWSRKFRDEVRHSATELLPAKGNSAESSHRPHAYPEAKSAEGVVAASISMPK